jgi:hypothetical protein
MRGTTIDGVRFVGNAENQVLAAMEATRILKSIVKNLGPCPTFFSEGAAFIRKGNFKANLYTHHFGVVFPLWQGPALLTIDKATKLPLFV